MIIPALGLGRNIVDEMLGLLSAKAAIADLVHTYALNIRNQNHTACANLFTADVTFTVRGADPMQPESLATRSHANGRDQVMAHIAGSTSKARVFPAIHNLLITLDGNCASATSLMIATVFPGGSEILGEYEDQFRRDNGKWLFSSRCYTIFSSQT